MKRILKRVDNKIPKLRWYDLSLIKVSTAVVALMVAKLYPPILSLDWYYYLIIAIACIIRPLKIFLYNR